MPRGSVPRKLRKLLTELEVHRGLLPRRDTDLARENHRAGEARTSRVAPHDAPTLMPDAQGVASGRDLRNPEAPRLIGHRKIGVLESVNPRALPSVAHIADDLSGEGSVDLTAGHRPPRRQAEVENVPPSVSGPNIVHDLIFVREDDRPSHTDGRDVRLEPASRLPDHPIFRRGAEWLTSSDPDQGNHHIGNATTLRHPKRSGGLFLTADLTMKAHGEHLRLRLGAAPTHLSSHRAARVDVDLPVGLIRLERGRARASGV